ncbi:MAG: winged helix-turn-helix domain-containing protein [Candidatus Sulfotelmatobacter sp.]
MPVPVQSPQRVRFRNFELDLTSGELHKDGQKVSLSPKAFEVLRSLVERPGEVVTREDLRARLWAADTFVEFDDSLNHAVKKLREALEDRADEPRYIETLPKYGYRFIADVAEADIAELPVAEAAPAWRILGKAAVVVAVLIVAGLIASNVYRRFRPAERLTEKDTVLLVDFFNTTGDPVFDDTLKRALSISLNQSPFLNVLSENKVIATSRMMGRPEGKPLTPDLASELCQRAGGKAYIAGSIVRIGYQYVVGLKAVNCANGDTLAQDQASAASKEKVLDALSIAAAKLRTELGESLSTVQKFDVPLQQATTSSLEALRAYSLGRKEAEAQGPRVALPYDQRAIQLDPNFAMGYFAVGYDYFILGEVGRASEYFSKAFELSSQVSEREKLTIAAAYYQSVTGNLDEAAQTYKEQIAIYPREYRAYLDLAIVYGQQGQYEDAVGAVRQAIRLAPDDAASYGILSYDLIASQRIDEARQAIEQAQARKLDDLVLRQVLYALAFLKSDPSAMEEQAAWFTGKAAVENSGLSLESDTAAYTGHLRRARELTGQSVDSAVRDGHKESAAIWLANAALREAGFGNTNESRRIAGEALKLLPTGQAVEIEAALALAMNGDTAKSAFVARDLSQRFPLDTQLQSLWLPTIQAQLALDKKEPTAALATLHVAAPVDRASIQFLANVSCLYPIYVRGEAYLAASNGVSAAAEFQKILDHSGIVWNCWTGALAHLGVARANALQARTSQGADADAARIRALTAYKDFLTLWEDADPDIPTLKEAKAEYARLR